MDDTPALALAARRGDRRALESLVEACYPKVWRFCAAMIGQDDADDLAQETFLRSLSALAGYRGDSAATTWLIGIARHVCGDHLRRGERRRRRDLALGRVTEVHDRLGTDISDRAAMLDLVGRIDADRREAFVLTQLVGLSYEEAAEVCGCATGTIRSRVARARSELIARSLDAETEAARQACSRLGPG